VSDTNTEHADASTIVVEGTPLIDPSAHRVLWTLTWILFALGMLEWFVLGANRPVDPVVSGAFVVVPLLARRFVS
jgi:hypothetical protein